MIALVKTLFTNFFFLVLIIFITPFTSSSCEDLDGSSSVIYRESNFPFNDATNELKGYVCLNNGFTVLQQVSSSSLLNFSGCVPISGVIDLRETSTLNLLSDIELDDSVTLSNGGHIYGNGNSIILQGDLTIPAGKVIHFSNGGRYATGPGSGTAIRGNGNTIFINNWAQIFVDTNTTLTISDAIIKFTKGENPGLPPIKLAAHNSKLALDNVVLDLSTGGNFYFTQGQLFVHNDVAITGTSAFIYTSPVPSWITSGGCLYFDYGTTFSIAPTTFTDAPYTLKNTYTNCNFIKMADKTSTLYLNGCSLMTTLTGSRLTKGSIAFNNANILNSSASNNLLSVTLTTSVYHGKSARKASWSPNGKYLAVVGLWSSTSGTYSIMIYSWSGSLLTKITSVAFATSIYGALDAAWSPDGRYLAISGDSASSSEIIVYEWNGATLTSKTTQAFGSYAYSVAWSPDGRFLAACGTTDQVVVYRWDGSSLTSVATYTDSNDTERVAWSNDGKYIALGNYNSVLRILVWDGSSSLTAISSTAGFADNAIGLSPDDRYIASGATYSYISRWNGSSITNVYTSPSYGSKIVRDFSWHPNGRYVASAVYEASSSYFNVWEWTGSTINNININGGTTTNRAFGVDWSKDGKYIAVAGDTLTGQPYADVQIFTCNYSNETQTQPLRNSIVFGDSAKGATYDADVTVLSGARVEVQSKLNYDCIS